MHYLGKPVKFMLMILAFGLGCPPAFAVLRSFDSRQASVEYCHAGLDNADDPHPKFDLSVDYQVRIDEDGNYVADPAWFAFDSADVNPSEGKAYARVIDHFGRQSEESEYIIMRYDEHEHKLSGRAPHPILIGGKTGPDPAYGQTLEVRFGSPDGPSQSLNFNLSQSFDARACLQKH